MPRQKKNADGCYCTTFVAGKDGFGKPKRVTVRGNEITPHYMRHTYATDMYAAAWMKKHKKFFGRKKNEKNL